MFNLVLFIIVANLVACYLRQGNKTPYLISTTRCTILKGLVCMSARTKPKVTIYL